MNKTLISFLAGGLMLLPANNAVAKDVPYPKILSFEDMKKESKGMDKGFLWLQNPVTGYGLIIEYIFHGEPTDTEWMLKRCSGLNENKASWTLDKEKDILYVDLGMDKKIDYALNGITSDKRIRLHDPQYSCPKKSGVKNE